MEKYFAIRDIDRVDYLGEFESFDGAAEKADETGSSIFILSAQSMLDLVQSMVKASETGWKNQLTGGDTDDLRKL